VQSRATRSTTAGSVSKSPILKSAGTLELLIRLWKRVTQSVNSSSTTGPPAQNEAARPKAGHKNIAAAAKSRFYYCHSRLATIGESVMSTHVKI